MTAWQHEKYTCPCFIWRSLYVAARIWVRHVERSPEEELGEGVDRIIRLQLTRLYKTFGEYGHQVVKQVLPDRLRLVVQLLVLLVLYGSQIVFDMLFLHFLELLFDTLFDDDLETLGFLFFQDLLLNLLSSRQFFRSILIHKVNWLAIAFDVDLYRVHNRFDIKTCIFIENLDSLILEELLNTWLCNLGIVSFMIQFHATFHVNSSVVSALNL